VRLFLAKAPCEAFTPIVKPIQAQHATPVRPSMRAFASCLAEISSRREKSLRLMVGFSGARSGYHLLAWYPKSNGLAKR
jgi:hypothetical protein